MQQLKIGQWVFDPNDKYQANALGIALGQKGVGSEWTMGEFDTAKGPAMQGLKNQVGDGYFDPNNKYGNALGIAWACKQSGAMKEAMG